MISGQTITILLLVPVVSGYPFSITFTITGHMGTHYYYYYYSKDMPLNHHSLTHYAIITILLLLVAQSCLHHNTLCSLQVLTFAFSYATPVMSTPYNTFHPPPHSIPLAWMCVRRLVRHRPTGCSPPCARPHLLCPYAYGHHTCSARCLASETCHTVAIPPSPAISFLYVRPAVPKPSYAQGPAIGRVISVFLSMCLYLSRCTSLSISVGHLALDILHCPACGVLPYCA